MSLVNFDIYACRICLSTNSNKVMTRENGWIEMFEYCFGLQINLNSKAKSLCQDCADMIRKFTKFKRICLKSDAVWKSKTFEIPEEKWDYNSRNPKIVKTDSDYNATASEQLEDKYNAIELLQSDYESDKDNMLCDHKLKCSQKESTKIDPTHNSGTGSTIIKVEDTEELIESNPMSKSTQKRINYLQDHNGSEDSLTHTNEMTQETDAFKNLCKCGKQFCYKRKYNTYQFHMYKLQSGGGVFLETCGLCDFSTQDVNMLCKHLDEHFMRNDLKCKLCDYTGRDFAEMAYHRYTHMKVSESRLSCLKCHRRFFTSMGLQFHFRSVHLKKKGGLCSVCGLQLSSIQKWKNHEKRKHSNLDGGESLFVCDCCGLKFVYRNEITTHLRERAGLLKRVCGECGAVFRRKTNLNSHIKNKHTSHKMLKCPECPKSLKDNYLQLHIKLKHGDKNYVCEFCSEKFVTKEYLQYHMFSHTGGRPYKCDLCGADYKTKSHLRVHMMRHMGMKAKICNVCHKEFHLASQLKRHSSVHTKLRAFKCHKCDRSFHYKKMLLEHCAKAHQNAL